MQYHHLQPLKQKTRRCMHYICQKNNNEMLWDLCWHIHVFVKHKINTNQSQVTKPSYTPNKQTSKRHTTRLNRPTILHNNNESNLTVLIKRQPKLNEDKDTWKYIFIPTGSTIAVQWEDGRLWMHGTIIGHASEYHNGIGYQDRSDLSHAHNHKDREACEGHSSVCRRLPKEWDVKHHLTSGNKQI